MNTDELILFIHEAGLKTYADPSAKTIPVPLRPGCDEYVYERGDWKYHDSYAWKRDGGGSEIVYYKGDPVWVMSYYGFLLDPTADPKEIYGFLHEALRLEHTTLPVRGDALEAPERNLRYEVHLSGAIEAFSGTEWIYKNGVSVYECYFHGGLVR